MTSSYYQAILARNPLGQRLTQAFLPSSSISMPNPNAIGRKKCSAGTLEVFNVRCSTGTYSQNIATQRANTIDGNISRFWVFLLKAGGCWKILRRRVRTARMLNHCLRAVSMKEYRVGKRLVHHNQIDKVNRRRLVESRGIIVLIDAWWESTELEPELGKPDTGPPQIPIRHRKGRDRLEDTNEPVGLKD